MAVVKGGIPGGGYVGRFGNAVFYESGGRTIMRELVEGTNPRTPEQQAGRRAQGAVAKGWRRLDDAAAEAWDSFGAAAGTSGYLAYMSLTRRWLRVNPGGTPPTRPPAGPFFGDAATLSISLPLGRGRVESVAGGPPPPAPSSKTSHLEEGVLTILASQANAEGVVTEILTQPLAGVRRKPRERDWKSAAYLSFAAGSLAQSIPLPKGAVAVAYRFVNARTGQATARASLGATTVA